jgi:hypothetical protein
VYKERRDFLSSEALQLAEEDKEVVGEEEEV